ncbi:DNA-directed RNA polymerase I subunit RPA43 [Misgurnus anguillicaudatus]|uniref:DNA-directed RNA polymerase I subunit RPA43 n=1 Tax=Misgurnus anguillicaudatus TaxID=75329 RepID=UPI0024360481|nr:DNA-directed RNA polymerase I subunit RPA43 [Misgurnus anguillicaudatus]
MANWTQQESTGETEPITNPVDVPSVQQIPSADAGGSAPVVPCLIPSFADAVKLLDARYSCLVVDTHRRHIALPPVYMRKKRTGIQEELNADLLKYSSSLKGVPVAYDNIKVVGQHGDIYDDQGYIHFNIEASFVVFKPRKGSKLVGVINKIGVGHVGCLVHGCFNASVVKPNLLTPEQWRDSGLHVGESLEFEVFQLDADSAGVLLVRGRLEKSRVQELAAQTEQNDTDVNLEPENTEDTDSPKPKKKKKKDKREKQAASEDNSENHEPDVDGLEVDCNSNRLHKKKKKKEKRKDSDETLPSELPASDSSSGYLSEKTGRKRQAAEIEDDCEMPVAKKKKKSK